MKKEFWLVILMLVAAKAGAQTSLSDSLGRQKRMLITDSTLVNLGDSVLNVTGEKKFMPVPRRAAMLALIPGGGQIYNRDYWKLPIVYIAFGGGLYAYYLNSIKYHDYLDAYEAFYDLDKNSPKYGQLKPGLTTDSTKSVRIRNLFATKSEYQLGTRDQILRGKNYWRRNRGLSIIVAGVFYTLAIIEANVAAHLKTFDLSDDLTLQLAPKIHQPMMTTVTPGLRLVFNFK